MYKTKKILIFMFILNMIFSITLVAYASDIRVFKAYGKNNFSSISRPYSDRFEVFDDLRFFEIYIQNKTSIPFVLSIKENYLDGEEVISKTINGNSSELLKNVLPLDEGTHYFTITSVEKNTEVNGCISVDLLNSYRASTNVFLINKAQDHSLSISVGSEPIKFFDAQPFVDKQGRTQVPIRTLSEMINLKVDWKQDLQTAIITNDNGDIIKITLGSNIIYVNDKMIEMDTIPEIKNNYIFIPIRFLGNALGFKVIWQE